MVEIKNHKQLGYSFMGVEIEINHDCNRACTYCPNSVTERKGQGRMSEKLFLSILHQLADIHYQGRISYHFYNEPLLSPDLDRFVTLTKEILPLSWIEIYTNGTLLTAKRLESLVSLGVDKFTVTKHHTEKNYPFESLYEGLAPDYKKRIKFQKYEDLHFTSRGGLIEAGPDLSLPLSLACLIPSTLVVVTVDGNVLPCFEDYNEENIMGNVLTSPLSEIWRSEKYTNFRDDLKNKRRGDHPVCKTCNCRLIFV